MADRCLGRLMPSGEMRARAPQLAGHRMGATRSLSSLDRRSTGFNPFLDDNDTKSDCTGVCVANYMRGAARVMGGYDILIPTPKVVAFYSQSTGYDGTPATDRGGYIPVVLANQAGHGFDTGAQDRYVGAWGTFDCQDLNLMRNCMVETAGVDLGMALSIADQNTNGVWDINQPASAGDPTPGTWGLHSALGFDFTGTEDTDIVRIGTWGYWQSATWRWVRRYVDEAHAIAWRQIGMPPGLNYDTLVADTQLFSGWLAAA